VPSGRDPRRAFLLDLLEAALAAVNGRARMNLALRDRPRRDTWVLAAGKAAGAMTLGAIDALGPYVTRALVVTRADCVAPELTGMPGLRCHVAAHPVPDERSLAAGEAALSMARAAPPGQRVLLLVSGGASSLLEAPARGVSLEQLRRVNEWALASGVDIGRINAIRGALSRVKAGGLVRAFAHCDVEAFFVSDVPGDDPAVVGSGLLASRGRPLPPAGDLPAWLGGLLERASRTEGQPLQVPILCVGRLGEALEAARRRAEAGGIRVVLHERRLDGEAGAAARIACAHLAADGPALHLFGGETTVVLPPEPGRGGRNQHLALAAAMEIDGCDDRLLLACGTDGSDGNTEDAGAFADGCTLDRGRDAGLDAPACLARADSGRFLEATGDLVHTGATGTNVGDLLFALRREPGHSQVGGLSM
jgi:glycerate 2-kinase